MRWVWAQQIALPPEFHEGQGGRWGSLLQAGLLLTISSFQPCHRHVTSLTPVYPVASDYLSQQLQGSKVQASSGLSSSYMD